MNRLEFIGTILGFFGAKRSRSSEKAVKEFPQEQAEDALARSKRIKKEALIDTMECLYGKEFWTKPVRAVMGRRIKILHPK